MKLTLFFVMVLALLSSAVHAESYEKIADANDIMVYPPNEYIRNHVFEDNTVYNIIQAITPETWLVRIQKTVDFDSATPVTTVLVDNATWMAYTGLTYGYVLPGNRMAIIGDYLQFVDYGSTDGVVRIHKNTGTITTFVSESNILALTGEESAALISASAYHEPTQTMAFYEQKSDEVFTVDAAGNLSIFITKSEFYSLYGYYPSNFVSGGMTFDHDGNFYWSSTDTGTSPGSGSIYKRDTLGNLTEFLSEATIIDALYPGQGVTAMQYSDIIAGPDNMLYFHCYGKPTDTSAPYHTLAYCDLTGDPNSIGAFISPQDYIDGPAESTQPDGISALMRYGSLLTWNYPRITDASYDASIFGTTFAGLPETCAEVAAMGFSMSADFNQDCMINLEDFAYISAQWLICNTPKDDTCIENWLQ